MNLEKEKVPRDSQHDMGWKARQTFSLLPIAGEIFPLTFSFIERSKKTLAIRGLNLNHNHDLKNIFKGAATRAAATAGPLQNFYEACVARGMKPNLARLTLARKIAAITLVVWKKEVRFDAEHLKLQAA